MSDNVIKFPVTKLRMTTGNKGIGVVSLGFGVIVSSVSFIFMKSIQVATASAVNKILEQGEFEIRSK